MPYEITYQEITPNIGNSITILSEHPSVDIQPVTDGSTYKISIVAINHLGVRSAITHLPNYTVIGKLLPPADVSGLSVSVTKYGNYLIWDANTEVDLREYEIRKGTGSFATSTIIKRGSTSNSFTDTNITVGSTINYWVRAQDTTNHYSVNPSLGTLTTLAPGAIVNLNGVIEGKDYKLFWEESNGSYAVSHYEIRFGVDWSTGTLIGTAKATIFQAPVTWFDERIFHIAAVDIAGNYGPSTQISITITIPKQPSITTQVIDNNILFYWTDAKTTLPVEYYEIRRGISPLFEFATATVVGTKSGLFTTLFETVSGVYHYWIVGIDSAGNYGTPKDILTTVMQPPDYILTSNLYSTFNGTLVNAALDLDDISLPHNTSESWETHFTTIRVISLAVSAGGAGYVVGDTFYLNTGIYAEYSEGTVTTVSGGVVTGVSILYLGEYTVAPSNPSTTVNIIGTGVGLTVIPTLNGASGWASPNEQVTDGFTIFGQPSETTGYYEETIDYLTVLVANKISVTLDTLHSIGNPTVIPTISTSLNGSTWTDYVGNFSIYATNFRYVKFRITVVSNAGIDILNIRSINIKLDSKIRDEAGTNRVFAAATGLIYNQVGFVVTITQAAHGRLVGEYVDLSYFTGLGTNGIYKVETIPTASSFTVLMPTSNTTSGTVAADYLGTPVLFTTAFVDVSGITTQYMGSLVGTSTIVNFVDAPYPTYFKILLYNSSGVRISGTSTGPISWAAKGF